MCSQLDYYKVIVLVILVLVIQNVQCRSARIKLDRNSVNTRNAWPGYENTTAKETGRGFFGGGLLSLSKVLNFFPVGGERECQPQTFTIAKAGICLNQYDCRQRDGRASGDCAHGLGVCCVFEVTCGGVVQNNLTYFMSPGFPELWTSDQDCNVTIQKTYAGIMQLKIDFIHFTIGQPNRSTGECDEDAMVLGDEERNFTLCGQNHGQHIYFTLPVAGERRESGELAGSRDVALRARLRSGDAPRLWLVRVAQLPLHLAAPHDCLQYHTEDNGTIRTFNYATNGRHLASQEYRACIRKNSGICSIRYSPCDRRSFRIGPGTNTPGTTDTMQDVDQMMPIDEDMMTQANDEEGSGAEPMIAPVEATPTAVTRIWTYIRSWMWGQTRGARGHSETQGHRWPQGHSGAQGPAGHSWAHWSPYAQHYIESDDAFRYYGYGNYGGRLRAHGRLMCQDRVTIPCENDYLISTSSMGSGVCDPHHCGNTFCPGLQDEECKVETSITPFSVAVRFGAPTIKTNPEDNIGMCLRYRQLPCDS